MLGLASAALTSTSAYEVATVVALIISALTGYLVYRANQRAHQSEENRAEQGRAAELIRAENQGWKSLIETLTKRYDDSQEEIVMLTTKLREAHTEAVELQDGWRQVQLNNASRVSALEKDLELAHDRHRAAVRELMVEIDGYRREIQALRQEVADLQALLPPDALKRRTDAAS